MPALYMLFLPDKSVGNLKPDQSSGMSYQHYAQLKFLKKYACVPLAADIIG
jgi:hypothetical protein